MAKLSPTQLYTLLGQRWSVYFERHFGVKVNFEVKEVKKMLGMYYELLHQ